MGKKILIIAGENSGDLHGSNLIRKLLLKQPDLDIFALGGSQMEKAGAKVLFNIVEKLSIIGIFGILFNAERIYRIYRRTKRWLIKNRPDLLICIDYPGFNLRMIEEAKKLGIKVVYYICPQVWAWHRSRIYKIAKNVDKALVILPFEEKLYKDVGIDVEYVGHPLLDIMNITMNREQVIQKFDLDKNKRLIGILPGSRKSEVETLLPIMLEAAKIIKSELNDVEFILPRAITIKQDFLKSIIAKSGCPIKVVDEFRYNVRSILDFAINKSGTSTLETALLLCPMIIVYKVSYLTWIIGKNLVKLPYIGLVNIVAGDMIVPELLQNDATPKSIAKHVIELLTNTDQLNNMKSELRKVKEKMGGAGASQKAADAILEVLNR